ncbi:hypothetical protein [Proteiniborus sp.]|uniref:hypothetical protein n=1 Tax=Proteiniborus sp. TaxID=2079015 RepID=UPI00332C2481
MNSINRIWFRIYLASILDVTAVNARFLNNSFGFKYVFIASIFSTPYKEQLFSWFNPNIIVDLVGISICRYRCSSIDFNEGYEELN